MNVTDDVIQNVMPKQDK